MWLYCRKTIILVQAFGNGRSSHARCCSPVGEPANSTPYNALIMRAVFFVRVVRLVRPLEHALLARIPERCLGVPLAGFATLGGHGFESVSVALLDKRRRYDEEVETNKNKQ